MAHIPSPLDPTPDRGLLHTASQLVDKPGVKGELWDDFARRMILPLGNVAESEQRPVVVTYDPGTYTNDVTTPQSFTPVDATNLRATFVAPASGKVRVRLSAGGQTSANTVLSWGIFNELGQVYGAWLDIMGGTAAESHRPLTADFILTEDPDGNPLAPGRSYTVEWRHYSSAAGVAAYTDYGAGYGPAIIEVTPLSNRLTDVPVTATVEASDNRPLWLCQDRTTVLGYAAPATLAWSEDEGDTWATHTFTGPGGIQGIRELDDGEILVATGWGGTTANPIRLWKSAGWSADKASSTFTQVLAAAGPDAAVDGGSWGPWSLDAYGPIVVAAEYGPKGEAGSARYVYLSQDYGVTWRTVFDLLDHASSATGAHLHGVAFDPWWDALWLSVGDGEHRNQYVSLDRGETWRALDLDLQFTTVHAMPGGVIWVTDDSGGNRILRLARSMHPQWETVYTEPGSIAHDQFGSFSYQSRSTRDAPLLVGTFAHSDPARIYATYDGAIWRKVWEDTESYDGFGIDAVVGPTLSGKYLATLRRSGATGFLVTLTTAQ